MCLAVHRLCNTSVLPHPLHGKASQNLLAKSAKQLKGAVLTPDKARTAGRADARSRALTQYRGKIRAFNRVLIVPLQYIATETSVLCTLSKIF